MVCNFTKGTRAVMKGVFMVKKVSICDVIQGDKPYNSTMISNDFPTEESSEVVEEVEPDSGVEVSVDFTRSRVEAIEITAINDEHGRISDIIEALEDETGLSVIPLTMGNIAKEVCSLARHKIFDFNGERYAMSYRIRKNVIDSFCERIVRTLSSGVPFSEVLNTSVIYAGEEFRTLSLSEDEWTEVLAKFRKYKQRLYIVSGKLVMEILGERA